MVFRSSLRGTILFTISLFLIFHLVPELVEGFFILFCIFSFFFVFLHHESIWTDNIGYDCIDGGADD